MELLPLGSVVVLKNSEKGMMISGYCPTGPARPGYVYDYCGFPYPEGYIETTKIYQFNHEDIDMILFIGSQDRETGKYTSIISENLDRIKAETAAKFANSDKKDEE